MLAVNKMDLVDWSQDALPRHRGEFLGLAGRFGFREAVAIPVCGAPATTSRPARRMMPWYTGPPCSSTWSLPSRISDIRAVSLGRADGGA